MIVFIDSTMMVRCVKIYLIKTIEVPMKLNEAVSYRIREILANKNMSQYKLEQLSGLTHNTMLCLINNRYESCNLKTLIKIIRALDLTPKEFFDNENFNIASLEIE